MSQASRPSPKDRLILAPVTLLALLCVACFWVFLRKAVEIGWTEAADWGHILAVPAVAAYWVHGLWPRLRPLAPAPDWRGLALLMPGLFGYAAALFPIRNGMLEGLCMVAALTGLVWLLLGKNHLRLLWAPLCFLLFTIRISDRLWELTTAKLQMLAAAGAAMVLKVCTLAVDFDVTIDGNIIRLFQHGEVHPLNVAEACSGIRSLMAFMALGFVLAWLPVGKAWWQRLSLFMLAAPVAIVVNIGRVAVLGTLTLIDPKLARGDFHILVGFLMLIPAAGLLLLCGWVLEKLVVEVEEVAPQATSSGVRMSPSANGADTVADGDIRAPNEGRHPLPKGLAVGATLSALGSGGWLLGLKLPGWIGLSSFGALLLIVGVLVLVTLGGALWLRGRGVLTQPFALGVALGVLGLGLTGQHAVTYATQTVLIKQPLNLRLDLHALPKTLGHWTLEKEEPPESAEVEHALGTSQYITRWYARQDGQRVRLHIAYYTGSVDTVPHVPDRCFVAAGATALGTQGVSLKAAGEAIPATFFQYRNGEGPRASVLYFFSANGRFLATPNDVRLQGFNLTDRFGYYCKLEVEFPGLEAKAQVLAAARDFMNGALPETLKCLPAWPPELAPANASPSAPSKAP